jgi:NADPH-dependent ferric siderophore reductase
MSSVQHITRTGQFLTTVTEVRALSPRMRRISLFAPEIAGQVWPLGCDIAVILSIGDGREVRRRYTVRAAHADTLDVDAVLHGHGPGSAWASSVGVGDRVTFFGPRGEVPLPAAGAVTADDGSAPADGEGRAVTADDRGWTLALTDESGLPAVAAVAERLTSGSGDRLRIVAEIGTADEIYPLPDAAEVNWLVRGERPAGSPAGLLGAIDDLQAATPPQRPAYAYVLGESRAIVTLRDSLSRLGLDRSRVYAKGYWNLNSRPTR